LAGHVYFVLLVHWLVDGYARLSATKVDQSLANLLYFCEAICPRKAHFLKDVAFLN